MFQLVSGALLLIARQAVTSLQHAGGIYGLVALSPSVGVYAGGRFTINVPIRVVQPATHPNNSLDFKTENNSHPGIKEEGQNRRRRRQASIPAELLKLSIRCSNMKCCITRKSFWHMV